MGISIRAYARHRGISDTAVRKAIKAGRITKEGDGSIDVEKADREWHMNTDTTFSHPNEESYHSQQQRPVSQAAVDAVYET
ncbi:hypothetical protein [Agarilytica rhodophyticola]|uniref:hypothetical protein n=1 Tax=Agarilytica rhodophyticola TaxID=1737490 RepID=UPI000B3432A3|nr:hypothetical protein [Agarilytica rhodophyticola]